MIKVSVLYPNNEGSKFDMSYYCNSHMPMIQEKLGECVKASPSSKGIRRDAGITAGLRCDGPSLFRLGGRIPIRFRPHANAIMADIPKYTDIQPIIQISEVKI